jgi:hypothetical protein
MWRVVVGMLHGCVGAEREFRLFCPARLFSGRAQRRQTADEACQRSLNADVACGGWHIGRVRGSRA